MAKSKGKDTANPHRIARILWPYENSFPEWSGEELFRLFRLRRAGAAKREDTNLYVKYLMLFIAQHFSRDSWQEKLDRGPGAADVANSIAVFIVTRDDRFTSKRPWKDVPVADGVKLLCATLNTTIRRKLLDAAAAMKTPGNESADGLDESLAQSRAADLAKLEDFLCDESFTDRLCIGVDADIFALEELIAIQRSSILNSNTLLSHGQLPESLRAKISPEIHALATSRLGRAIRTFATELN